MRFTVDGTNNNTGRTVNGAPLGANYNNYPSTELVAEFKVSALGNDAQYASASDITITTKSGTNAFHGSLFEYMQNAALDAVQVYRVLPPNKGRPGTRLAEVFPVRLSCRNSTMGTTRRFSLAITKETNIL